MSPATHPRPQEVSRRWWTRWPMALWLTVVWVLLWGSFTPGNIAAGLVLAVLTMWLLPMPKVGFDGRVWLPGVFVLLSRFAWEVVVASYQIASYALRRDPTPHGAVVRVRLRTHSDVLLTITAQFTSLVPGSVVVEAHRLSGVVYVHVFDAEISGGIEAAKATVLEQERRIMYALASDAEIEAAGYPPRGVFRVARPREGARE
ncbi:MULTISPECIES: Na+/H+ antiporter subunit E [unclassified Pseudactinotalea]|uniref:Na+/H+ antiporter subunit E n=1 Tax=unclassified Pseudactinotalea TaxID=2649176 RepID=UPI00128B5680|nr:MULTISPECIES: Na+/H+ antiporter subunit E [unclassified Pseudactinotalea]MPV50552.1 Na+/H+ antiporter subunit E [Pseudactinotalea sp. HY160]QGH70689.1 Na+/H+ antiporter subunit E [Pseudactinotalea sp. HY158]